MPYKKQYYRTLECATCGEAPIKAETGDRDIFFWDGYQILDTDFESCGNSIEYSDIILDNSIVNRYCGYNQESGEIWDNQQTIKCMTRKRREL